MAADVAQLQLKTVLFKRNKYVYCFHKTNILENRLLKIVLKVICIFVDTCTVIFLHVSILLNQYFIVKKTLPDHLFRS